MKESGIYENMIRPAFSVAYCKNFLSIIKYYHAGVRRTRLNFSYRLIITVINLIHF